MSELIFGFRFLTGERTEMDVEVATGKLPNDCHPATEWPKLDAMKRSGAATLTNSCKKKA